MVRVRFCITKHIEPPLMFSGGADQLAKKELAEVNYRKQYRSNLGKIISFLSTVNLRPAHIARLRRTPFYTFLEPFISKKVPSKSVTGMQKGQVEILMAYNRNDKEFHIGGHSLTIHPTEFELLFGVPSGDKEIDMTPSPVADSAFGRRKFPNKAKVTATDLLEELEKSVKGTSQRDIEDTVRILILHTVSSVFFVACADVARGWQFKLCEDLDKLRDYNWSKGAVDYLNNYLQSKKPKDVRGCTAFLQVRIPKLISMYLTLI